MLSPGLQPAGGGGPGLGSLLLKAGPRTSPHRFSPAPLTPHSPGLGQDLWKGQGLQELRQGTCIQGSPEPWPTKYMARVATKSLLEVKFKAAHPSHSAVRLLLQCTQLGCHLQGSAGLALGSRVAGSTPLGRLTFLPGLSYKWLQGLHFCYTREGYSTARNSQCFTHREDDWKHQDNEPLVTFVYMN